MKRKLLIILISLIAIPSYSFADFGTDVVNKIGYGATEESEQITKENYALWVDLQLNPPKTDPLIDDKYNLPRNNEELYKTFVKYDFNLNNGNVDYMKFQQTPGSLYNRNLNRRVDYALNSEWRIREFMVWFWYNHFNNGPKFITTSLTFLANYEDIIRANAFGNFKDLLYEISINPGMQYYLNNNENIINKKRNINALNENYAREFLELHTMGVGSGYTQDDIINLAKVLSGHGLLSYQNIIQDKTAKNSAKNYDSLKKEITHKLDKNKSPYYIQDFYLYQDDNHSKETKVLLGKTINPNGRQELKEAIDIIVKDPRTAHFISKKIGTYFIGESVSDELIEKMSSKFQETDGDIKETVRVLLLSKEFENALGKGTKVKDGFNFTISTLRTPFYKGYREKKETIQFTSNFLTSISAEPYHVDTPQGFYIDDAFWRNPTRLQEYIFFTQYMFFNPEITDTSNYFNYKLISNVSNSKITNPKEALSFFTSPKWLER